MIKAKILVVDDEEAIREVVATLLEAKGYDCSTVGNGLLAREYLKKNPADLVLSDMVMPEMDGFSLLEWEGKNDPDVPVIIVTAMLADVGASAPDLQHVLTVRSDPRPGTLRVEDLITGHAPAPDTTGPPPSADAPHCIIYTSGTESRPKGCLHTLNTITFTVHALGGEVMAMGPADVMFMPSPVTHATGLARGTPLPATPGARSAQPIVAVKPRLTCRLIDRANVV